MNSPRPDERGLVAKCPECGQLNRLEYQKLNQEFRCGKCHKALSLPAEPVEIENEQVFHALTTYSSLPVLVDFWAPWCGPCKMVAPELVKVAAQGVGRWLIAKANSDELHGAAQRYQIQALPTLVLFNKGREVARQSGAMPATGISGFIEHESKV